MTDSTAAYREGYRDAIVKFRKLLSKQSVIIYPDNDISDPSDPEWEAPDRTFEEIWNKAYDAAFAELLQLNHPLQQEDLDHISYMRKIGQ